MEGTRTYFFYNDEGLIAEYDTAGNELRSYGYKPDSLWTTDPLFLKQDEKYYFYQNNHLGTPQKLVDLDGTVGWAALYDAFGQVQITENTIENNMRFPGQYFDAETGLHYNWNRCYDPITARYTQADPIGFYGGDMNLYAYVWNDPGNLSDPVGLKYYNPGTSGPRPLTWEEGSSIMTLAEGWIPTPWVYGGATKNKGVDCSHFIHEVYKEAGFAYPYTQAGDFYNNRCFEEVYPPFLQPADVIDVGYHVGVYHPLPPSNIEQTPRVKPNYNILSTTTTRGVMYAPLAWFPTIKEKIRYFRYIQPCNQ